MKEVRLLKILRDKERCEFCPDAENAENKCAECDDVEPVTLQELHEYYQEMRKLVLSQRKRHVRVTARKVKLKKG